MNSLTVITVIFATVSIGAAVFGFLAVAEEKRTAPMLPSRLLFGFLMGSSFWVSYISITHWFIYGELSLQLPIIAISFTWFIRSYIHLSITEDEKHKAQQLAVGSTKAAAE